MKTIFAISTPQIQSAISLFRISGPETKKLLDYFQIKNKIIPRTTHLVKLKLPCDTILDHCILIYFSQNYSFTGEEVIELHTHGSIAIQKTLTHHLSKLFQHAEPGEFTRQAVLNKRMNLIEAEGLHDLITSYTWEQHKQAINQMQGILYKKCKNWKQKLIELLTQIEGYINFEDEAPKNIFNIINTQINEINKLLQNAIDDKQQGLIIKDGINIGIFGNPNSGKSTLMNKLTLKNTSIISNIPGTTTDIITTHIDFNGYPIILYDTAGIRKNSNNTIEKMGINKSLELIKKIHIKIIIIDITTYEIEQEIIDNIDKNTIILLNKADLKHNNKKLLTIEKAYTYKKISILKDDIQHILNPIGEIIKKLAPNQESAQITQERHYKKLNNTINILQKIPKNCQDLSIIANILYLAINEIAELIDKIDDEDILNNIFKNFCIGK